MIFYYYKSLSNVIEFFRQKSLSRHLKFATVSTGWESLSRECHPQARILPRPILVPPHIRETRSFASLKAAIIKYDMPLRLYSTNLARVASRRVHVASRRCNALDKIKAMTGCEKERAFTLFTVHASSIYRARLCNDRRRCFSRSSRLAFLCRLSRRR